ncbi:MAG: ribosome maturation factor RimP [Kiloniellaceae bacterium]
MEKASAGLAKSGAETGAGTTAKTGEGKTSEGKAAEVERLIAPAIEAMGYDIVRVQLGGGDRLRLQIMAERRADGRMNVDDCAEVSRAAAAILDVEDPIDSAYTLEVSSPGIDRPLTRLADFDRFAGFEARVETGQPVDGRRRFRGKLVGIRDGDIVMLCDDNEICLPFADLLKAKLVLTDELIAASRQAEASPSGAAGGDKQD